MRLQLQVNRDHRSRRCELPVLVSVTACLIGSKKTPSDSSGFCFWSARWSRANIVEAPSSLSLANGMCPPRLDFTAFDCVNNCNRTNSGQTTVRKFARVDLGTRGSEVSTAFQLPRRLPVGTKYVVEICGEFVRGNVELPNGARILLRTRKARLSISSKRRRNGAGLQGPRWPRQSTRPNHRRE
jgi:hypothetical protein